MNNDTPPSTPPLKERLINVLTSKEKASGAIKWRLIALRNAIKRRRHITYQTLINKPRLKLRKRRNLNASRQKTITRLQEVLSKQEESANVKAEALQKRLKVITDTYSKQKNETNAARIELNNIKQLIKGDALEQLTQTKSLLKTKSSILSEKEARINSAAHYLNQTKANNSSFSIDNFVMNALISGYHTQGRFFLLDKLKQADWKELLGFFKQTNDGFDSLEKLRPMFAPWIQNYHALIDVIEDQGYTIRPLENYIDKGLQDKSVYIYHDVHAWDIIPALGMVLANKDRGICTTFCLNIDQAHVDIAHQAGYEIFGTLYGENAKLGLHCNPFASWIRMDLFNADEQAFLDWYNSEQAEDNLAALVANKGGEAGVFNNISLKQAEAQTYERLNKNFKKLKTFCPDARTANHHGDSVNKLCVALSAKRKSTPDFLFVTALLRNRKAEKLGVLTCPTGIRRNNKPVGKIYGELQNRNKYYENLHAELASGDPWQLINHPGAISNGGLVMNLDFVRKLGTGSFEKYPPLPKTERVQTKPLSQSILQIDEND